MMRTSTRLGAFALGLAVVFTASLELGRWIGPMSPASAPAGHTGSAAHGGSAAHCTGTAATATVAALPAGLQIVQAGYQLTALSSTLATGRPQPFRFHITGPDGKPVTRYTIGHGKALHLIVARRDLSNYQHVHPTLAPDGTWTVPLAVAAAGQYRVFADFQPAAHAARLVLGVDVPAAGDYQPRALPAVRRTTTVDGYTVTLAGDLTSGTWSRLTLSVAKGDTPITDLQPYLGAYGHLVALRAGDLAYSHVHPDGAPGDGRTPAGPQVSFRAEVPSSGRYRLFLDFQHAGKVRTAGFTAVAAQPATAASGASTPAGSSSAGSGCGAPGHSHG